jgi:hypothetical protein
VAAEKRIWTLLKFEKLMSLLHSIKLDFHSFVKVATNIKIRISMECENKTSCTCHHLNWMYCFLLYFNTESISVMDPIFESFCTPVRTAVQSLALFVQHVPAKLHDYMRWVTSSYKCIEFLPLAVLLCCKLWWLKQHAKFNYCTWMFIKNLCGHGHTGRI